MGATIAPLGGMLERPWAIDRSALAGILEARLEVSPDTIERVGALSFAGSRGEVELIGSVARIPICGVLQHRATIWSELFGESTYEGIRAQLRSALANPAANAIVLDIESPGGAVDGCTELAAEIRSARNGSKPIVAVARAYALSAAYWLASQATEIVAIPSGEVGSIGIFGVHQEYSRMLDAAGITTTVIGVPDAKTEVSDLKPLTDEAAAFLLERAKSHYRQFLADVAKGREVDAATVEGAYGGGRTMLAAEALRAGAIDRVEPFEAVLRRLGGAASRSGRRTSASAAASTAPPDDLGVVSAEAWADAAGEPTPTFSEELVEFGERLAAHAQDRARLRAKEGRPAFGADNLAALRAIRDSLSSLLETGDPEPSPDPAAASEPVAAPPAPRPALAAAHPAFRSREEWLAHLQESVNA